MVAAENSQLQFEPFRSGRDGQVVTGIWSVGNVGRIGCGYICRSLSRLRRASVACQDMSIECGNVSIECGSLQGKFVGDGKCGFWLWIVSVAWLYVKNSHKIRN